MWMVRPFVHKASQKALQAMSTFLWWRLSLTQGPHFAVLQHGPPPPSGGLAVAARPCGGV